MKDKRRAKWLAENQDTSQSSASEEPIIPKQATSTELEHLRHPLCVKPDNSDTLNDSGVESQTVCRQAILVFRQYAVQ